MSAMHTLLSKLPEWPLITQKTARKREENAFSIGVDAGRAIGDTGVSAHFVSGPHRP